MTFKEVLRTAEKFVIDNSPGILTGLGVAGTVTTAILAGKAAYSSALVIESYRPTHADELTVKQQFEMTWKEYIPAAVALSTTITAIVMANHIGSRRAAAIAAAFKLSEKMSEEYREKIVQTLGKNKEEVVRTELAADRMAKTPGSEMIYIAGSEVVFFDELSGRYFKNEVESVKKAVNEINHQVNNFYCASLTEFYEKVGLPKTVFSDEVGWNTDSLLEVHYNATLMTDGRPAIGIAYNQTPIHGYDRCS